MPLAMNREVAINYAVQGAGEPLLLIPGLGGGIQQMAGLSQALAPRYRVITVDPRGAGGSGKPDLPYDGAELAADMAAVLDHAGCASAHVAGISFGGMIAQQLALLRPHAVRSLLLASSYAAPDAWSGRMWAVRQLLLDRLTLADHFKLAMLFLFSPRVFREQPEALARVEAAFAAAPPDPVGYRRQLDYCATHDTRARLGSLTQPTLVVQGAEDILATPFQGRDLAATIPGARYREIPAAAHLFMLADPAGFAELARRFHAGDLE